MNDLRAKIVDEAVSWIGTPYHPHARLKGVGVDCAMFLAEVYERVGVMEHVDAGFYPKDWHLHQSDELFLKELAKHGAVPVWVPKPGDVAMFKFGRAVSHGAIVVCWPCVVHSFHKGGVQLDDAFNGPLNRRYAGAWSVIHA